MHAPSHLFIRTNYIYMLWEGKFKCWGRAADVTATATRCDWAATRRVWGHGASGRASGDERVGVWGRGEEATWNFRSPVGASRSAVRNKNVLRISEVTQHRVVPSHASGTPSRLRGLRYPRLFRGGAATCARSEGEGCDGDRGVLLVCTVWEPGLDGTRGRPPGPLGRVL